MSLNLFIATLVFAAGSTVAATESEDIFQLLVAVESCRAEAPQFAATSAEAYSSWTARNARAIAEIRHDSAKSALLAEELGKESRRLQASEPRAREVLKRVCEGLVLMAIGGEPILGADTPLNAWLRFVEALKSGDAEKALTLMSGEQQANYRKTFEELGPQGMRAFAQSIVRFDMEIDSRNMAEGVFVRDKGRPVRVEFIRSGSRWFIASM